MADHVYHWKHGWIPLTPTAALSKAKGNHALAQKYLASTHGHETGIRGRRDVAGALLDLPNIPDASDRQRAHDQIKAAAERHGADDLLPMAGKHHPYAFNQEAFDKGQRHGRIGRYSDHSTTPDESYWYHQGRASTDNGPIAKPTRADNAEYAADLRQRQRAKADAIWAEDHAAWQSAKFSPSGADDLREHVRSQSDSELRAMLGRQLSTRLRKFAEAEASRRGLRR